LGSYSRSTGTVILVNSYLYGLGQQCNWIYITATLGVWGMCNVHSL